MRTGTAYLPLHGGHCPPWLFARMVKLSAALVEIITQEFGPEEVLRRLADPVWFQAFGCVLGFDWHSSGLTTTVCGALKEGLRSRQAELGIFLAGGKGMASRQTPQEISTAAERYSLPCPAEELQAASRLAAKVDNTAVQDGYQLYHHFFIFTRTGEWAVIQQGMNPATRYARRYHWLGSGVEDFVQEPHSGICGERVEQGVLDLTAGASRQARQTIAALACERPERNVRELQKILAHFTPEAVAKRDAGAPAETFTSFILRAGHEIPQAGRLDKALLQAYACQPQDFQELLTTPGVGPATIRALAMVAEIAYGVTASHKDPVRYSFAHGGKDGHPFPVQRGDYDHSLAVLREVIAQAKVGRTEKMEALRRLARWREAQEQAAKATEKSQTLAVWEGNTEAFLAPPATGVGEASVAAARWGAGPGTVTPPRQRRNKAAPGQLRLF